MRVLKVSGECVCAMKEIRIYDGEYEKTDADKCNINIIFSHNAVHYITAGEGEFNGKRLGAGKGFICRAGEMCTYHPVKDNPWAYIWVKIEGEDADEFMDRYASTDYVFDYSFSHDFTEIFSRIFSDRERLCNTEISKCVFGLLSSYNADSEAFYRSEYYVNLPEVRAKKYIDENYHKQIRVEDIAESVGLARNSLRNRFYDTYGKSPKQYLTQLRLSRARRLLEEGRYTVTEIARSVGYDDVFQFIKLFGKVQGISPTAYRKAAAAAQKGEEKSKTE